MSVLVLALAGLLVCAASAQDQPNPQQPAQGQEAPPAAGGPGNDVGPYAIPKKKEEPPPPPVEKPKKIEGMPDYSLRVDVPLVNVPVMVTTKDGQTIPNLTQENFRILEDGVPQKISNFTTTEAPITAVMLIEAASANYYFYGDALQAAFSFTNSLKKEDWTAVVSYDIKPRILSDFSQNKPSVLQALQELRTQLLTQQNFSETNLYDSLYDTIDRIDSIPGHKDIILISTGLDTFSKLNLDKMLKKIKATKDVTIFPISVGFAVREYFDSRGGVAPHAGASPLFLKDIDYLQADNQMRAFAQLSGGRAFFPRFSGEFPSMFQEIGHDVRNQYLLAYHPTNPKLDGTYRKLKVEVVAPDGGQFKVHDQHGKDLKYLVIAREGYTAKHQVE
ncbi:MAG: VWA domain-containing protein [Acidobacteriales bacterium]|nr:VWA domain-containing protein [Terriglobales bacterium]